MRELCLTVAIYSALVGMALFVPFGWLIATLWICGGIWFVANTQSRGWLADASFVATWPIYLILDR